MGGEKRCAPFLSRALARARDTENERRRHLNLAFSFSLPPPPQKKNNKKPGGAVLSWIDVAAGLAAKTLARGPVVTASVDAVAFLRPARRGSVAIVAAMVNRVFRSSAEVGVRVEEEVLATGERRHCCSAYLTFVSVGRAGVAPVAVMPPVAPGDGAQAEVFAAAERRRAERLAARARARECPGELPPRLQPVTHRGGGMPTLGPPLLAGAAAAAAAAAAMASSSSLYSSSALPPPRPQPQRIPPAATLSHMTQLILPQHANSLGITFGGVVLNWVEQCAHIAGARAGRCLGSSGAKNTTKSSRGGGGIGGGGNGGESEFPTSRVLTAGMDSVAFGAPTRVGDVLYVSAQVTAVWGEEFVSLAFFGERERELFGAEGEREREKRPRETHSRLFASLLSALSLSLFPNPKTNNKNKKGASMEVMVSVCAETPSLGGRVFECGDAFVTVVAVDGSQGKPVVPSSSSNLASLEEEEAEQQASAAVLDIPSDPSSPDARRAAGADARRQARLRMRQALLAHERRRPSLDGRPMSTSSSAALAAALNRVVV